MLPLGQGVCEGSGAQRNPRYATPIVGTNVVIKGAALSQRRYRLLQLHGERRRPGLCGDDDLFLRREQHRQPAHAVGLDGTTVIEFDDDNGSLAGLSSSIAGATIPITGTYYIKVNDFTAGTTSERPYELHLRVQSGSPTPRWSPTTRRQPLIRSPPTAG